MKKCKEWKFYMLLLVSYFQMSRAILTNSPRLRVDNGNLIIESGVGRNLSLNAKGSGFVVVNGVDVSRSYALVESVRPQLETLNTSSLGFLIRNLSQVVQDVSSQTRLAETLNSMRRTVQESSASINHLQNSYQGFQDQINLLKSNVSTMYTQIMTPEQRRLIQNLTNAVATIQNSGSGTHTGSVNSNIQEMRRKVTRLESQMSDLEERVNVLDVVSRTNGTGSAGGSVSSQIITGLRRMYRRINRKYRLMRVRVYTDNCDTTPCYNGGICIDTTTYRGYTCICKEGYKGDDCNQDVDECSNFAGTDLGCQNGATCLNNYGNYLCHCPTGWYGIHCTQKTESCTTSSGTELCGHGTCIPTSKNGHPFTCICDQGWTITPTNPACVQDVNECLANKPPCSHDPPVHCINTYGSFTCGSCPPGYEGTGFACRDIDECAINNGGCSVNPMVECINARPGRNCGSCPSPYVGDGITCTLGSGGNPGPCDHNPCHPFAICQNQPTISNSFYTCTCRTGYTGNGIGPSGCVPSPGGGTSNPSMNPCNSNPCVYGQCSSYLGTYHCACNVGYTGPTCAVPVDWCAGSPCLNGGTCTPTLQSFSCVCPPSHTGDRCQTPNRSCGGSISGQGGVIYYPHVSQSTYHHNVSCAWVISVNRSQVINITFTHFHLEEGNSQDCPYDWLQIHDGPRSSSQLIGRFCGENTPGINGTIISTHNHLYMWFRSDHSYARTGFNFTWNATTPSCGYTIRDQSHGSINSPGYPGRYPASRDCYWTVEVTPGKKIQFAFATLQIETHPNCSYDYLAIRDGLTEDDHLLARYCSTQTPEPVVSSSSEALVHFHSDTYLSDTGFHITFVSIPGLPGCGGLLTNDAADFSPPTSSELYHHNLECEWRIRLPPGEKIELNFTSFHLESSRTCMYDYVEVRDGRERDSPLIGRFCGDQLPEAIHSTSNFLFIRFKSDYSIAHAGFTANYRVACGGEFTAPTGVLESPYHPNNYPHDLSCIYVIRLLPGTAIKLNFTSFDLEESYSRSCYYDYLEIKDGIRESSPLIGKYCGPQHRAPDILISSLNGLHLRFKTDGSVTNRGFSATYSTIDIRCGGIHHQLTGSINSPNSPDTYPGNTDCTWVIDVPENYMIQLTWHSFSLESHFSCNFDYLQVFDNTSMSQTGDMSGRRYCGTDIPSIMTSQGNILTIHFHSDSSLNHDGFSASYHALDTDRVCGGNYHTSSGRIVSPNFPDRYPHRRSCTWTITVSLNHQIRLNFTRMDMEGSESNCPHDFLEIRNGNFESSPLLQKLCGRNQTVGTIISHSHQLLLKFVSDSSISGFGFEVFWDEAATGCGGTLTSPTGEIMSPGYPEAFHRRVNCFWTIRVNEGSQIGFHFTDLDIENSPSCTMSYVEMRDGPKKSSPLMGRYCNNNGVISFNSTGNTLRIKFKGGWTASGRGFRARYRSMCNTVLEGHQGVIESPNFPNRYPHQRNCTWTIKAPLGNGINISFSHFDIEGSNLGSTVCEYDFLEVRVGRQKPLNSPKTVKGRYCGTNVPTVISSGMGMDIMEVQFNSDPSVALNGFRLEWIVSGCGGTLRSFSGTFESPNFPNAYPANTKCEWHIIAYRGLQISITIIEFDIESSFSANECTFDALKVYGGEDKTSPVLLTLCHHERSSKTVTTQGSNALVTLTSDGSVRGRGFKASYRFINGGCGGEFSATKGEIHSPSYPDKYDNHADCVWYLKTNPNHVVELEFKDFDIEPATNCSYDYLAVFDGDSTSAPVISQHCGASLPSPSIIRSTGQYMTLRLKADSSMTGRGFKAEYKQGCGATIVMTPSSPRGAISSPNYPGMITPHTVCHWHIRAPEGSKVQLIFTHMNIRNNNVRPSNVSCPMNYVQILDGDIDGTEIGRYCGTHRPRSRFSSAEMVTINLLTRMVDGTGFRIDYSSVETNCGGEIYARSGEFASPNYPDSYPMDFECIWIIHAGDGSRIQLNFEAFDIEESEGCNLDYLEVHESNPEGSLLLHNCSSAIPPPVAATDKLWIKFKSDNGGEAAPGFLANFVILQSNELNADSGYISSPLYPHLYTTTHTYEWTIVVEDYKYISFEILDISIELNSVEDVCYSSLVIHDGFSVSSYVLSTLCGYNVPSSPIVTRGNVAFVQFISRFRHEGSYFRLRYSTVSERPSQQQIVSVDDAAHPNCSYVVYLTTNDTARFKSINYPENYNNNMNCEWIIETSKHSRVRIMMAFRLEESSSCIFDKIEIYDGIDGKRNWNKTATLCRRNQSPRIFTSTGSVMRIRFKTDLSVTKKGFYAFVRKVCGGVLAEPDGVIHTNNYPSNYRFSNCEWKIKARTGRTIQMRFDDFRISNQTATCSDDSLLIHNGASKSSPFLGIGRYCGVRSIPTIPETSSNNALLIFSADRLNNDRGFHITYHEVSAGCGGHHQLTSDMPSLEIMTPNYPHPPHPHSECIWVISGPPTKTLTLEFIGDFHVNSDYNPNCEKAYVEVLDGGTELATGERYCGSHIPNPVHSTSSTLYIKYFTNVPTAHSGFKAKIEADKCGGTYRIGGGYLSSPNYPDPYDDNMNCTWHIIGPYGHYMVVTFFEMNIYNPSPNCSSDAGKLSISDPVTNITSTYCGEGIIPPVLELASNNATITFTNSQSGGSINKFRLIIIASREECGGLFSGSGGLIKSPGYPFGISHTWQCEWRIQGPPGSKISLTIEDIDFMRMMNNYCVAHLKIYNGLAGNSPVLSRRLCSSNVPLTFNSSMNGMRIVLVSPRPTLNRGFKALWTSEYEQECGGLLTEPRGTINSPSIEGGGYKHNMYCVWTINNNNPTNTSMSVTIDHLHLTRYCIDNIQIEGVDPSGMVAWAKHICLGEETLSFEIPYPTIRISFISGRGNNETGFRIQYEPSNCGGYHTGPQNVIQSPGFGNGNYPDNSKCSWLFVYSEGSQVELEFTSFRLENSLHHDYVKIFNGRSEESPVIGQYTGNGPVAIVGPSMSSNLLANFVSDGSSSASGFRAVAREHTLGCGGIYHGLRGNISSPGFDKNEHYSANSECIWEVQTQPGYQFRISFVDSFDLETSENCPNDFVQVSVITYENESPMWRGLDKNCGKQIPSPILTNSSAVRITLRTNSAVEGKGFKIRYDAKCGGTYNAKIGYIISPNHPDHFPALSNCLYRIIASPDSYVVLNFTSFSLHPGYAGCDMDSLLVQQMPYDQFRNRRLVNRYTLCGEELPDQIALRGPVNLNFTTKFWRDSRYTGFMIKYSIKDCGGNITEPGVITLPTNPGRYLNHMVCVWDIKAPQGKVVHIKFQKLLLEHHPSCNYDHVSIYDGFTDTEENLVTKLCGDHTGDLPRISTPSSMARMVFESDVIVSRDGFEASVSFTYKCGDNVNISEADSTQTIRSLDANNDGTYEPMLKCQWLIQGHPDMVLYFNFTRLDIEGKGVNDTTPCPYDAVELFDGPFVSSISLGKFCGSGSTLRGIVGTKNVMTVVFHSDSMNQRAGFTATVGNVPRLCGSTSLIATETPQPLQSPNYPSNYPNSVRCFWVITAPDQKRIRIHIDELHLEDSPKCTKDKVIVEERGQNQDVDVRINAGTDEFLGYPVDIEGKLVYFNYWDLLHVYCGNILPSVSHIETRSSKSLQIQFNSDEQVTNSGFRLHYQIATCNDTYTKSSGRSSGSRENANCYITIRAPANKYIALYIKYVRFISGSSHSFKVYDGDSSSAPVMIQEEVSLNRWAGNVDPVYSSGNALYIVFFSPGEFEYNYDLYYTTSESRYGCGGEIFGTDFTLRSPNHPNPPQANKTCIYTVTVPQNYHATVGYSNLGFSGGGGCNSTYLQLWDVTPSMTPILYSTYCEGDTMAWHVSPSNRLVVKFVTGAEPITGTGWNLHLTAATPHANTTFNEEPNNADTS